MAEMPKELQKFKGPTREKIRRALAVVLEAPEVRSSTKAVSVTKLRGAGAGDANATTELLRAWRAGQLSVAESWDDATAPSPAGGEFDQRRDEARRTLEGMIREAAMSPTDGAREKISMEVMAQLAGGLIEEGVAKEIKGQLEAALKAAAAKRQSEPPAEDPTRLLLASELAMKVARVVDLVVSDPRRERIASFVARELEQDLDEERNLDAGGVGADG